MIYDRIVLYGGAIFTYDLASLRFFAERLFRRFFRKVARKFSREKRETYARARARKDVRPSTREF